MLPTFAELNHSILGSIAYVESPGAGQYTPIVLKSRPFYMQRFDIELIMLLFDTKDIKRKGNKFICSTIPNWFIEFDSEKSYHVSGYYSIPAPQTIDDFLNDLKQRGIRLKLSEYAKKKFDIETLDWSQILPSMEIEYNKKELPEGEKFTNF